ncbi:MAG: hypothetical protein RBR38_05375 [Desulfomicrobium apsheronum]|nr:hypothetical protein [Desulfomicrobium apsheronum]
MRALVCISVIIVILEFLGHGAFLPVDLDSAPNAGVLICQAGFLELPGLCQGVHGAKKSDLSFIFLADCFGFGKDSEEFISVFDEESQACRTCPDAIMDISGSGFMKEFYLFSTPNSSHKERLF